MVKTQKLLYLAFLVIVLPINVPAQDKQARIIFRSTYDLSPNWYLTGWAIGNAKSETPQNGNLFLGIGYRNEDCSCWLDSMAQRQYSESGRSWLMDFRFSKKFRNGTILYAETTPSLNEKAFYDFVFLETPVWKKLKFRVETENVHRPGFDSIGGGAGVGYPVGSWKGLHMDLAVTYQFRWGRVGPEALPEPNAFRVYLVLGRKL